MYFENLKQQFLNGSAEIRAAILLSEQQNLTKEQIKELLTSIPIQELPYVEKYL